jgi:hypothetical protein
MYCTQIVFSATKIETIKRIWRKENGPGETPAGSKFSLTGIFTDYKTHKFIFIA